MPPSVSALDHLVLTVADPKLSVAFYRDVLGMAAITFAATDGTTRQALRFGAQKINLHEAGAEFDPKARLPTPGSADLCFLTTQPIDDWLTHLTAHGVPITDGPVRRSGATGPILSLYVRDPDGNLIEISAPLPAPEDPT